MQNAGEKTCGEVNLLCPGQRHMLETSYFVLPFLCQEAQQAKSSTCSNIWDFHAYHWLLSSHMNAYVNNLYQLLCIPVIISSFLHIFIFFIYLIIAHILYLLNCFIYLFIYLIVYLFIKSNIYFNFTQTKLFPTIYLH